MFRNYIKIAWRNIRKNGLYSFINILGLTTGITCCILIALYITDEISYDKFHANADRIARVTMDYSFGGTASKVAVTGTKAGPQFKRTFPAVEDFVRIMKYPRVISYVDKPFTEKNFLYADSSFFKIFSFPLLKGNEATALNTNDKVVVTESAAKKYFGTTDALGKTLRINNKKDYTVSAVAKDVPHNSQIQFDFVISFNNLDAAKTEKWEEANYVTYLLLHNKNDIPKVQQQIMAIMKSDAVRKEAGTEGNDYFTFHLEPLTKVHLYSSLEGFEPNGSLTYIYVLAVVALLILIIACVNYTNLAIAQSANRSGEIGIRKVMGAERKQLLLQFIGESSLITFIAVVLALLISWQFLPVFNDITGKHIVAADLLYPKPLLLLLTAGIFISLMAGAYPALVLSGSAIIKILKAGFSFSSKGAGLRKSLIVVQFVISLFLIISTIIILQQMSYIRNKKLGYDKDRIIVLPIDYQVLNKYDALKKQISLIPGVTNVSGAYDEPTFVRWADGISTDNGLQKINFSTTAMPVDLDFIKTMDMQIVAGTDYSPADLQQMDTSNGGKNRRYTYMLNETAAKKFGWTPEQAVGKTITKNIPGVVKAVVKDFHFASLHDPIGPMVIFLDTGMVRNMFIKVQSKNIPALLAQLEKIWKENVSERPFDFHFLDESYNKLYTAEQRTATVFSLFAGLAILLACLGLFGLAAFTTIQRTKEIGIRKVLGADIMNITMLISKDFIVLVGIAIIVAAPLAWLAANKWLEDFAYRIHIQAWIFIVAGVAVALIALLTVSFHAIRAALMNPVKSLRTE